MKTGDRITSDNDEKGKKLMMDSGTERTNGSSKSNNEGFKLYPKALAKYSEVNDNKALFMQTLEKFHSAMKTKFMVPVIGGKDLDLHKLFKEVTVRGGIDKVIGDRRWKEVTASFEFPATATNASFILRKYYYSLLHHYEKLYFLGSQGCSNTDSVPALLAQSSSRRPSEASFDSGSLPQKRKTRDEMPPPAAPITGVIDGKFEHGYFVTVKLGSHTLRGALYYCPEQPPPPSHSYIIPQPISFNSTFAFSPGTSSIQRPESLFAATTSGSPNSGAGGRRQRRRRKKRPSTMDPNHPKPNRSGYNFFFAEQHAQLKPLHPGRDRDISRIIGERWSGLSEAEKNVYQERGREDKQRYQSELALYKERQKAEPSNVISDAVPISQIPAIESGGFTVEGVDSKVDAGDLALAGGGHNSDESDGTDESEEDGDGGKNKGLDLSMGSVSGSGSESDAFAATKRIAAAEERRSPAAAGDDVPSPQISSDRRSAGDVPSPQIGSGGFELRKRDVSPAFASPVEIENPKDSGEAGTDAPVGGTDGTDDVKMAEGSDNPLAAAAEAAAAEGDVKMGEDVSNPEASDDVKMAEALHDIKAADPDPDPDADVEMGGGGGGKEVATNQVVAVRVSSEEDRMVDNG